jgi:hypothetical protein
MELLKLKQYEERSYAETPSSMGYVNYGEDNLYPQYLIDLFQSSATHNALCTSIAYMLFGDGVQATELDARLKAQEWGLDEELRKACLDLKIQGGFALEVVYSIDRTTIAKVRHCPFENIRSGDVNDDEVVEHYYYSKDWSDKKCEPEMVCAFDPAKAVESPHQILYVKPFSPGSYFYPKPDYIGSVNYIELDKEIGVYHINNIKNGLAPSFTIHFKNGVPAQEERRRIRNDIERQLAGATNAGKFIVTYSDSPDRKPDFEPFPLSDADKQYQFLSEEVVAKIMVGHRVTSPMMFGVMVGGKLGGGTELATAETIFKDDVITPYQRIITDALEELFNAAGTPSKVMLTKPQAEEANVDVSYTGVQIGSAVDIITKTTTGELTKEQASQLLIAMLGFDSQTAARLFETQGVAPVELSEQINLDASLDFLYEKGEEVDEDEWELIDEVDVDLDLEPARDALWAFATRVPGDSKRKSDMDNEIVRIRYKYDGGLRDDTREFCKKMVQARRVWRKEDIMAAGELAVNPGFGPNGTDTYSIWEFKGGPNCHHRWVRQTYLKKAQDGFKPNEKISVAEAKRIISRLPEDERKRNKIKSEPGGRQDIKPINMPNRGYLNPR